ncbi:hypothetical protein [Pseudarthrobacter sp. N5]|uniref:hypothetical protein n=1 Tax=Pseudarthrobacter sp. N5 TaxID=3418416 RepID=UPI003CFA8461
MDTPTSQQGAGFTPIPDGPTPIPFPNPLPDPTPFPMPQPVPWPQPGPLPWPPDDWWKCWRRTAISGRYEGNQAGSRFITRSLDLRLDIDKRNNVESPVMNRISGDLYSTQFVLVGGRFKLVKTYLESWIVDTPAVSWSRCSVTITGAVRYWQGTHPATTVTVQVPWEHGSIGTATVTFNVGGTDELPFSCTYRSGCFRDVNLELDYAASVDIEPKVPVYGSHWHNNRPGDTPDRTLNIESAYREAGVSVTVDPTHTSLDDSAAGFATWSVGELHDAMESSFSRYTQAWPAWNLWGLQAGTFDSAGVGGIMFDAAAGFGGAGRGPDRQGFAVFRNHSWFTNLTSGTPANQDQAWAMRHFLYTWVHEAGHAFNFLHAWDKSRPDSLSWMNYDWKYDQRNGADSFWAGFRFRFDDDELIHMRHGDRASVIMGGDPWASGGHLESPAGAVIETEPGGDVELSISAKDHFDFMEPVSVEFRLRNTSRLPVEIDTRMDPKYGNTVVYIRKPNGSTVLFDSVVCFYGLPELKVLAPAADTAAGAAAAAAQGDDRHSELVPLTFGVAGFAFDAPGQYLIRAVYHTAGVLQTSNTLRLRVGYPVSKAEDRFAPDFFTREVGLTLAFEGSMSPHLATGLDTLTEAAARFAAEPLGVKAATAVAQSVGDDFYRRKEDKMVKHHSADPDRALSLTAPGLEAYQQSSAPSANLAYRGLVELRTAFYAQTGEAGAAKSEVETLAKDLDLRGANASVLSQVRELIPAAPARAARAPRARRAAPKKPAK